MPYQPYGMYQPMYQGIPDMRQYQPPMQQTLQQPAQQVTQQMPQQQGANGIIWVQGEEGAKAYMVAPGNSVFLMDSEASVFYIKSSDASGMPMPLRIFDYTERTATRMPAQTAQAPTGEYVTRQEFNALAARMDAITHTEPAKEETDNA